MVHAVGTYFACPATCAASPVLYWPRAGHSSTSQARGSLYPCHRSATGSPLLHHPHGRHTQPAERQRRHGDHLHIAGRSLSPSAAGACCPCLSCFPRCNTRPVSEFLNPCHRSATGFPGASPARLPRQPAERQRRNGDHLHIAGRSLSPSAAGACCPCFPRCNTRPVSEFLNPCHRSALARSDPVLAQHRLP